MIEDLKLCIAGWAVSMAQITENDDAVWNQKQLKTVMDKYELTQDDIMAAIPNEWKREG